MSNKSWLRLISLLFLFNFGTISAQDWAQLNYYAEANEKLINQTMSEDRVVFMGNSITIGWLDHYPEFFENKAYINRGISGQTTPQMLVRFRQDVIDLSPSAVVILAGTNDIAGNTGPSTLQMIMDNIKGMAEIASANDIQVVLASVLPAFDYPWRPGLEPNKKIPQLNRMIRSYAMKENMIYLDYFSALRNEEDGMVEQYAYDGVHPNKSGYKVMAPLTTAAIEEALKK